MPAPAPNDIAKIAASCAAVGEVQDGMRLGLGTGSTAAFMVRLLGARARAEGLSLTCVATSARTAAQAAGEGLRVVSLDEAGWLDLTIDGADEIAPDFTLIKGGGGAHLREKIVAAASDRMLVIADAGKQVAQLGAFALPVEVLAFGAQSSMRLVGQALAGLGYDVPEMALRAGPEGPFRTDEGNHVLDLALGRIGDARALSAALNAVPGVVENGLFIDLCSGVLIGHDDGRVSVRAPGMADAADMAIDLGAALAALAG